MTYMKSAFLALALTVTAVPAVANGPALDLYPNLTYPEQTQIEVVTKNAPVSQQTCTVLERSADVETKACGTLSRDAVIKQKFARDE